ncbi:MAG: tyrosine-type recombinase/integrase [Nitrosopumilus sp.]|nr:tyrosine-type recombinase/integrase [Nitrosopumilus sp.]
MKKDTLSALKRLYHYSVHDEIADKSKGKEYDPVVSWITPGSFVDKYEKIQAKDLLTDDETLRLIRAIKEIGGRYVKRNIALVFTMFEGAYRPGELFRITIGGLEIEDDFIRIHTTGKTGPKSLILVSSFGPIRNWLSEHPYSDDPNAFLFYHNNDDGLITYQAFSNMIKKAHKIAGLKKRVWGYLFRHTALTEYAKRLEMLQKSMETGPKGLTCLHTMNIWQIQIRRMQC